MRRGWEGRGGAAAELLTTGGRAPRAGELFKNPAMAASVRSIEPVASVLVPQTAPCSDFFDSSSDIELGLHHSQLHRSTHSVGSSS